MLTLTDLDPDARVPPLRPLLPEWRNWLNARDLKSYQGGLLKSLMA